MWRLPLCALALCVAPSSVLAQVERPLMKEGDRVRVSAEGIAGIFVVLGVSGDTVALQRPLAEAVRLQLKAIRKLEISRGRRSAGAGALRGAGIGLAIGAGTGAIIGLLSGDDDPGFLAFSKEEKALAAGVLLGGAGVIVGGAVGLASPGERWERVALYERLSLFRNNTGTIALTYSHRF